MPQQQAGDLDAAADRLVHGEYVEVLCMDCQRAFDFVKPSTARLGTMRLWYSRHYLQMDGRVPWQCISEVGVLQSASEEDGACGGSPTAMYLAEACTQFPFAHHLLLGQISGLTF